MPALLTLGVEVDWGQGLKSCSFEEDSNLAHSLWARRSLTTPQFTAHPTSCLTFLLRLIRVRVHRELSAPLGTLTHCHPLFLLVITQLERWTKKPSVSCKNTHTCIYSHTHTHKTPNPQPSSPISDTDNTACSSHGSQRDPRGAFAELRHLIKPRSPLMSGPGGWWTAKGSFLLFPLGCSLCPQWIQPLSRLNRPLSITATSFPNKTDKEIG